MPQKNQTVLSFPDIDWSKAEGPLPYSVSNDYLFRALMQKNNNVLKAFVCAALHLGQREVSSIVITNPIELGENIDSKDYVLGIRVELNRGDDYIDVRPAVHIGILNFPLFPEHPEFYATCQFRNIRTGHLYSDKLRLSVLELNRTALATEEDKRYKIDLWARFFKASTWEELKMTAKNNTDFQEAITTTYQLSQEEKIRMQCEAREDYYRRTRGRERLLRETLRENTKLISEKERLSSQNEQLSSEKERLSFQNELLRKKLAELGIDADNIK